jgi:hypothetical protein
LSSAPHTEISDYGCREAFEMDIVTRPEDATLEDYEQVDPTSAAPAAPIIT